MEKFLMNKDAGVWKASLYKGDGGFYVTIENTKTGFVDYPVMYKDGSMAFNYPERLSKRAKQLSLFICICKRYMESIDIFTKYNRKMLAHKSDKFCKFLAQNGQEENIFFV